MKPDWKDAPEWAQWLAMDEDGTWYWHKNQPTTGRDGEWLSSEGRIEKAGEDLPWYNTKEPRP